MKGVKEKSSLNKISVTREMAGSLLPPIISHDDFSSEVELSDHPEESALDGPSSTRRKSRIFLDIRNKVAGDKIIQVGTRWN